MNNDEAEFMDHLAFMIGKATEEGNEHKAQVWRDRLAAYVRGISK